MIRLLVKLGPSHVRQHLSRRWHTKAGSAVVFENVSEGTRMGRRTIEQRNSAQMELMYGPPCADGSN